MFTVYDNVNLIISSKNAASELKAEIHIDWRSVRQLKSTFRFQHYHKLQNNNEKHDYDVYR